MLWCSTKILHSKGLGFFFSPLFFPCLDFDSWEHGGSCRDPCLRGTPACTHNHPSPKSLGKEVGGGSCLAGCPSNEWSCGSWGGGWEPSSQEEGGLPPCWGHGRAVVAGEGMEMLLVAGWCVFPCQAGNGQEVQPCQVQGLASGWGQPPAPAQPGSGWVGSSPMEGWGMLVGDEKLLMTQLLCVLLEPRTPPPGAGLDPQSMSSSRGGEVPFLLCSGETPYGTGASSGVPVQDRHGL